MIEGERERERERIEMINHCYQTLRFPQMPDSHNTYEKLFRVYIYIFN